MNFYYHVSFPVRQPLGAPEWAVTVMKSFLGIGESIVPPIPIDTPVTVWVTARSDATNSAQFLVDNGDTIRYA